MTHYNDSVLYKVFFQIHLLQLNHAIWGGIFRADSIQYWKTVTIYYKNWL